MLTFESYWNTLPLNSVPKEIIDWYTGRTPCQAILTNSEGNKVMIHFRYSSHLWTYNARNQWERETLTAKGKPKPIEERKAA